MKAPQRRVATASILDGLGGWKVTARSTPPFGWPSASRGLRTYSDPLTRNHVESQRCITCGEGRSSRSSITAASDNRATRVTIANEYGIAQTLAPRRFNTTACVMTLPISFYMPATTAALSLMRMAWPAQLPLPRRSICSTTLRCGARIKVSSSTHGNQPLQGRCETMQFERICLFCRSWIR